MPNHITFSEEDRKLITQHDVKLGQLCSSVKELKDSQKDLRDEIKDGFKDIAKELKNNSIGCVTNRANCRTEMDGKFVTTKTILLVISANTALLTAIGFLLKWTGVIA